MRNVIQSLEESKIREVANAGMLASKQAGMLGSNQVGTGRTDVLKFWFGESDEVTADFIRQAAIASLQAGETFYCHNLGLPELREAVAANATRLHQPITHQITADRVAITAGGVNALMLACQILIDAGG